MSMGVDANTSVSEDKMPTFNPYTGTLLSDASVVKYDIHPSQKKAWREILKLLLLENTRLSMYMRRVWKNAGKNGGTIR